MPKNPTYEELQQKVKELEKEAVGHKRANEELQTILNVVPVIIFQKDRDGKTIRTNQAFNNMIGLLKEEIIGKTTDELFPEHGKDMMKDDQAVMELGKPKLDIIEHYDSPKGTRWARTGKAPIKDKEGNVVGLIGYAADITEQKQTAEALRKNEEKYRTLFENSKDAIYISTRSGKYIAFNQSFLDLFGYTEEDMMDVRAENKYIDPDDRVTFKKEVEEKGSVKDFEVTLQKKDGTKIYGLITATLWRTHDGSILGYQGIIRDITKQKLAEEALRESEEKWRSVFEQSGDPIVITTRNGEFVDANQSFMDLFGYTKSNALEIYAHPEDRIRFTKEIEEKGSVKDYELMLRKTNGKEIIALCSSTLRRAPDGSILGYQSIVRDITQKRKTLEALRKSEAQKKAILDASIDHIRFVDRDLRIIWANQTTVGSLNADPEDLLGQYCYKALRGRNTPCAECPSRSALKSGKIEHAVLCRLKKQEDVREKIYVDSYGVPIKNKSGDVVNLIQISRDITKIKMAEKSLKVKDSAMESSINAIALAELGGGSLTYVNRSFLKLWGYDSRQDVIGQPAEEFWQVKEDALGIVEALSEVGSWVGELSAKRKDGSLFDAQISATMFTDDDGLMLMMASFLDITKHKQAVKALRQREEELKIKTNNLQEVNVALKVLLQKRDEDKIKLEEKVLYNVKELIFPYVEKLKGSGLDRRQTNLVSIIESNLDEVTAPLLSQFALKYSNLTPKEIQVANLVKRGKTTKEIAKLLISGTDAIEFHRKNLRMKLGLKNTKSNLRSYLLSLN